MTLRRVGDMEPGSIIQLRESGVAVNFIVAMHNYRSAGKTLLVRQSGLPARQFINDSGYYGDYTYTGSALSDYLEGTYLQSLDQRDLVESTDLGDAGAHKVFALHYREFGFKLNTDSSSYSGPLLEPTVRYAIWKNWMGSTYWTRVEAMYEDSDGDSHQCYAYYFSLDTKGNVSLDNRSMRDSCGVMACLCISADCTLDVEGILRDKCVPELTSSYFEMKSVIAKRSPFKLPYSIRDKYGDVMTVTESVDGNVWRTFEGYSGEKYTFELTKEAFEQLEGEANHTVTVTVTDGCSEVTGTYTFYKSVSSGYRVFVGTITGKGNGYYWSKRELLHDAADTEDRFVLEPDLILEKNDPGSFSFKVPVTNPARKLFQLKKAIVSVEEDGQEIWCGYVTEMTPDYDLNLEIYCDGELSYLGDMPCKVENKVYTVNELVTLATTCPDSRFRTEGRVFLKGNVTVTKPDDKKDDKDETSYTTCWDALNTCLVEKFNGILRLRKIFKMENGLKVYYRYLDYLSDVPDITEQTIEFGSNLLDLSYYMKAYSIVNSVKAYGYTTTGWWIFEKTKPIEVTVNNEKSIELYGLSQRCIIVDGKKSDTNSLKKAAQTELNKQDSGLSGGIKINAGDLVDAGVDVDRLGFLRKTRIRSVPHGIDDWVLCTKEEIPLDALDQKKFTFGDTAENITASLAAGATTAGKAWNAVQSAIGYIKNGG